MGRVIVLGGGPAGLLAAYSLHRRGWSVTVLDRSGPRPQAEHAHRLPAALWQALLSTIPGLRAQLLSGGALLAPGGAVWCSRALLDGALRRSVSEQLPVLDADITDVGYDGETWAVEAGDGQRWSAPALVDATGARRASLSALGPVTLDVGPLPDRTASAVVSGLGAQTVWCAEGALLLPEERGQHRLSLRCPTGTPLPRSTAMLRAMLPAALAAQLDGCHLDEPRLSGGRPCRRPVLEEGDFPSAWALVGDAAVETPPALGWGLWLAWQCAERLQRAETLTAARAEISQLGQRAWEEAMLRCALAYSA